MEELLEKMSREVFARRPVLEEIIKEHGHERLGDYVAKSWQTSRQAADPNFVAAMEKFAQGIYGAELAQQAASQVATDPIVNTVEHHGILNHPIFVNSSLIYSLHFKPGQLSIALSTESVSLNNTSSWSASLMWHEQGEMKRRSFLTNAYKNLPVFSAPAINAADIGRFRKQSDKPLNALLDDLQINNLDGGQNFSSQASVLSARLWQLVFPSAPQLLYLPLESIVLEYLLKIFENPDEFLSKIILTAGGRGLWQKYFPHEHTFLFWGIDHKGRRVALTALPEGREQILDLTRTKKIYPSSPLCFAALLRAGMVCAGGFTQTTWLSNFKEKLVGLLSELQNTEQQNSAIKSIPTKNYCESSLARLVAGGANITPTAVDLYLSGKDFYPQYQEESKHVTLAQSFQTCLPVIYSVVVPKTEQNLN